MHSPQGSHHTSFPQLSGESVGSARHGVLGVQAGAAADVEADDGRQLIHLAALSPLVITSHQHGGGGASASARVLELLVEHGGRTLLHAPSGHGWSPLFLAAAAEQHGQRGATHLTLRGTAHPAV